MPDPFASRRTAEEREIDGHGRFTKQIIEGLIFVFLSRLHPSGTNVLFFADDLGQRIFQQPFSWTTLGVDVRGHSQILKINYRTSHQIRQAADRLLPDVMRNFRRQ
jgi:hypothetical protein